MKKIKYDKNEYNFAAQVAEIFGVEESKLENLHELRPELMPDRALTFETETRTDFHQTFYKHLNSSNGENIKDLYKKFLRDIIRPLFPENFLYQKFPSFRVHIPNDQAVHKWHYDSDEDHRHPDWEINFQIALTKMFESNAMWLESVPNLGDFSPVEMEVGDFCIFYGNKCCHGNKENLTGKTRVSMDFRILPFSKYDKEASLSSVTSNRKFVIGDYYAFDE
jgi:ectoine hydroxylase-related dioxygenase (phytanoyl-CoA dioxygenase family)